jgi:CheY-like chemotaxis protein/glycine cleavage system H lipoate-binding protein
VTGTPGILVVDDEEVVVSAVKRILQSEGYVVRTTADVAGGLRILGEWNPDIVLTDLKLPGRSGIDLVREVRDRWPQIVVIAMTGYANTDHAVASLLAGAFDFLPKPFSCDELLATLRRAMRCAPIEDSNVAFAYIIRHRPEIRLLGWTSWAFIEAEGTAMLGCTDTFVASIDRPSKLSLPDPNRLIQQGGVLASVTDAEGDVHTVRSALGGRVAGVNTALESDIAPLLADAFRSGWIARVIPDRLGEELGVLTEEPESIQRRSSARSEV